MALEYDKKCDRLHLNVSMDSKQILCAIKLLGENNKVFEYNGKGAIIKVNGKIIMDFVNEELIVSF